MCSIPGLPTPGSEVSVLITRVNLNPTWGLVELWVNMDDERKHIYEQMREDIQIPKRKFCGSEGKPGDLCLVCISNTWHRARIVSIQNETYDVFLIDQGRPHITTIEALAYGECQTFLLPPETESCILANLLSIEKNWPERAQKFLKTMPDKKFKGLVQHVLMPDRIILLDLPILSKHMCKCGVAKKIPVDDFKCLVLKCLPLTKSEESEANHKMDHSLSVSCQLEKHNQYFYPELLTNTLETVTVTEVSNPQNFFCKLLIFSKALEILSEQMQQCYKESSDLGEAQPQTCGDPCAARGLNGRWYRSLLKQNMTRDGAVEVFHVDEGKTEFVPVGDIKPLHGKFLRMPVVTYACSLDGVIDEGTRWTTDQTDYLKSLLLNQTVVVRLDHHNISQDVYSVTLYANNGASINTSFIEKTEQDSNVQNEPLCSSVLGDDINIAGLLEEARLNTSTASKHPNCLVQCKEHLSTGFPSEVQNARDDHVFTVGNSVNVNISCIESLQKFWCQTTENADSLTLLMQNLKKHYAFGHSQPLVESVYVVRNPDNNMWYRARIIASHHSPVVDVRFIDYGQTRKVPLRDVHPIDPAFLQLDAQAFQCCLFSLKNDPTATTLNESALIEFQKFAESGASSDAGLKCTVNAVMTDEEGMLLNMVDIETPSDSACKLLAQKCAPSEAHSQIPPQVPSDAYSCSTYNIEVGAKEKVWITSSENVSHFCCQLDRNLHLFEKVIGNVQQLIGQPQCTYQPLALNSMCLARYTDDQWYRGQVVEMSPKLKVQYVDYGNTLEVNESDVCALPTEASIVTTVPVLAVPLGLFDVPEEVPQEVNQWFSDLAIDRYFTISVEAKGPKGKLIVELLDGSVNVNLKVRERISQMTQQKMTDLIQPTKQPLSNYSEHSNISNEDCLTQELTNVSGLTKMTEQNKVDTNGICAGDDLQMSSQPNSNVSAPEIKHKMLDVILEEKETVLAETFIQGVHSDSEVTQHSFHSNPKENLKTCIYKRPNISLNKTEDAYASCIVGPHFFWCQYTDTEDLNMVLRFAQEMGQMQQDMPLPNTLDPGSPCLALFPSDNQWYRAQVIQRSDNVLRVVFIDYGNESDVDSKNVRPLPQSLLDKAPQAFLCSLNGFDESRGSWDDSVYDDFYNLLVDKPLKVTVFNFEDHSEIAVAQYLVEIECEGVVVNTAMQKYWKPVSKESVLRESPQTETVFQDGQTESTMTHLNVSNGNLKTGMYREPKISKNRTEMVYASCIAEPHFFWCQYANTEELDKVARLAQEAGQVQHEMEFPKSLVPGSPCLALFSSDNQWYRAQVIHRVDEAFHVVFIDYGNESDVDNKDVRPLPQSLLEKAPRAFLCSLNGFDKNLGFWDDNAYDDFYNLLVDKPLTLTVLNMDDHSEIAVPQYAVQIECEGVVVNTLMEKYWKVQDGDHASAKSVGSAVDPDK